MAYKELVSATHEGGLMVIRHELNDSDELAQLSISHQLEETLLRVNTAIQTLPCGPNEYIHEMIST